jgi:hypothetical protein
MSTPIIDAGLVPPYPFPDELSRAKACLGSQLLSYFYHDTAMQGVRFNAFIDSTGGTTDSVASGGYQLTTVALVGSFIRMSSNFSGTFARPFPSGANWFCSGRFKIDSTIDATTQIYVGLADPTGATPVRLGVYGPSSATNYVLQGPAGTFIDSGIAIDASYHTFRAFKNSSGTYLEVDDVRISGNVDTASDTCPVFRCYSGSLTVQQVTLQWWCGAAVRP